jgi:small subunit ribosomal protein S9
MADENVNETEAEAPEAPEATEAPAAEETAAAPEAAAEPAAEVAAEAPAADSADDTSSGTSEGTSSDSSAEEAQAEVDLEALRALVSKPAKDARYQATGKRKRSVARVILTPGDGTFLINANSKGEGRTLEQYFDRASDRTLVLEPLVTAGAAGAYNVRVRVHGGGNTGQTGAVRHGISKALAEIDPALRTQLKGKGFLKVDTRQVERKKAGFKKARKKPQFSKR